MLQLIWESLESTPPKVDVLLNCLMGHNWVKPNDEAEYDIRTARNLFFEFVGGEPAEGLRQQFATPIAA
jgi:hypothetical protein